MDFQNIQTVEELKQALEQYNKNLPITIFDKDYGYISVAFKKETSESLQWLTFYPNFEAKLYTVQTLISYLSRLPEKAIIAIQDEIKEYSPLFLSVDETVDNQQKLQWLVISDKKSYNNFFFTEIKKKSDIQGQAFEKMLKELEENHSSTLDSVHNWLCKQEDEELFKGILKEDRTLKNAMEYCIDQAKKQANNQMATMVDDDTVFSWVKKYFLLNEVPKIQTRGTVSTTNKTTTKIQKEKSIKKEVEEQQIALF
ncbi:hypothetical protein IGK74_002287 [Enterococcus sp. AZ150]|uniref:Cas9 inhibitor AcrIIA9 family protein n=1 Tax=Enterococcus sp. AZ150 TaxID=2774866 RepID=UPI003F28223D